MMILEAISRAINIGLVFKNKQNKEETRPKR
jgi:hypothetical protein